MALNKTNVPFSLNQGINTKVDPKQLPFGSFTRLENVVFDKEDELNKRNGYTNISATGVGNTTLQPLIGISKFRNQPIWVSKDQVYSYAQSSNVWNSEGSYDAVVPESNRIVRNGKEQEDVKCAYLEGYQVFTYLEAGAMKFSVLDENTENYIIYNQTVPDVPSGTNTVDKVNIATFERNIWLSFVETNSGGTAATLYYKEFDLLGHITDGLEIDSGTDASPSGGKAFGASQSVSTVEISSGSGLYDMISVDNTLLFGYHDDSANELKFKYVSKSRTLSAAIDPFSTAVVCANAIDLNSTPLNTISVCAVDNNNLVKYGLISNTASAVRDVATVEDVSSTGTATNAVGSTNVTSATTDGLSIDIFYQVNQTNPYLFTISTGTSAASTVATDRYTWNMSYIRKKTYTVATSTFGSATDIARGVGLASKGFSQDINNYINVIRESFLHATYYTMKSDGSVQAKISQGSAGPLLNTTRKEANLSTGFYNHSSTNTNAVYRIAALGRVAQIDNEKFIFANSIQGKILSGATGTTSFFSLYGVNATVLNFSNAVASQTAELGDNLHFGGGQLKAYDGNVLVEESFNFPPNTLTKVNSAASTATGTNLVFPKSSTVNNTWLYRAIYNWTDAQGNVHRSGLSDQLELTLETTATGTGLDYVDVKIPPIDLTQKTNVYLELYRTAVNGTVFYRLNADNFNTSTAAGEGLRQTFLPIENTTSADMVVFRDNSKDSDITANEVLYTTGGILENTSPPSNAIVGEYKNRLFLAGLENKLEIRYSKLLDEKVGVEFNDTLFILVPQVGGDIVALKGMDDKLIIFKKNSIYFIAGDGPNNLGQQDTFSEPQLISSDVGCENKNSIVLSPQGLFFKSNKGIFRLSRSLGLSYVGAPVEDFNDLVITKGDLLAKKNEIRFLTNKECLVYNYYRGFWTTFSNHAGEGSVVIGDDYYYVKSDPATNKLFKQSYTNYDDGGAPINMLVETGWMNPIAAQSAIRVYRMLILGDYFTPHRIKVSVCYDYDDTFVDTSIIDVASYTEIYAYGDPGVKTNSTGTIKKGYYGDPGGTTGDYTTAIPYGGKDVMQYQMRVNFSRQKCEAMKIKIETVQEAGQLGRGVNLSQLLFTAGSKGTDFKIKQGRVFTTSK